MAKRKPFLLRIDPTLHASLQRWADDDLRSLNGQIEFLLREAVRRSGRLRQSAPADEGESTGGGSEASPPPVLDDE